MDGSDVTSKSVTATPSEPFRMLKAGASASVVGLLVGGGAVALRLAIPGPGTVGLLLWTGFALAAAGFLGGVVAAHRFTPSSPPGVVGVDYKRRLVPVVVAATALSAVSGSLSASLILSWDRYMYGLVFVSTALLSFCACLLGGVVRLAVVTAER